MPEQTGKPETPGFNTRAVHAGQEFEPRTGAVVPPLHFSSTYAQEGIGGLRSGYEYGRGGNPTRDALQEQLAANMPWRRRVRRWAVRKARRAAWGSVRGGARFGWRRRRTLAPLVRRGQRVDSRSIEPRSPVREPHISRTNLPRCFHQPGDFGQRGIGARRRHAHRTRARVDVDPV